MWANAQRDGRPAKQVEFSVQRRKVWLTLTTRCHAVTLPRRETRWNFQGWLKLPDRSQSLVGRSSPYCGDFWRTYCCVTSFFSIVDTCLSREERYSPTKLCNGAQMAIFGRQFFCVLCCQRAACSRFQTCILNSHKGHTMCGSMADIQSAAAEIRRGK